MKKKECDIGQPCGNTCISKTDDCTNLHNKENSNKLGIFSKLINKSVDDIANNIIQKENKRKQSKELRKFLNSISPNAKIISTPIGIFTSKDDAAYQLNIPISRLNKLLSKENSGFTSPKASDITDSDNTINLMFHPRNIYKKLAQSYFEQLQNEKGSPEHLFFMDLLSSNGNDLQKTMYEYIDSLTKT